MWRHAPFRGGATLCLAVACSLLPDPAGLVEDEATAASRRPSVVIYPKPGLRIRRHSVRFVVHAGPEHNDLRARLNGFGIGWDFGVRRHQRRVVHASASHGLRYGRNMLKVVARSRGRVRRATVRFTLVTGCR
jgi:hypothetical protein